MSSDWRLADAVARAQDIHRHGMPLLWIGNVACWTLDRWDGRMRPIASPPLVPLLSPHRAPGASSTTFSWTPPHTWSLPTLPTHTQCEAPSAEPWPSLLPNDIISLPCSSSGCLCTCPIPYHPRPCNHPRSLCPLPCTSALKGRRLQAAGRTGGGGALGGGQLQVSPGRLLPALLLQSPSALSVIPIAPCWLPLVASSQRCLPGPRRPNGG